MNTTEAKNWYETILDSQKKMAESMKETAKKFGPNEQVNQTLESSSDFFKKWLDLQMDFAKTATPTGSTKNVEETVKENFEKWKGFYETFFKSQVDSLNNSFSQNSNMFKNWTPSNPFIAGNPFTAGNPFSNMPNMDQFGNWSKSITDMYQNMMANFKGEANAKDVFEGLYTHTQSFMKFYEMWSPVMKAMENNSFKPEMLQNIINPESYKQFMDSFFGFMPANVQTMYNDGMSKYTESMQNFSNQATEMFKNNNQWQQYIPQGNNMFTEALSNYNNVYSQMQNAVAPFAKLVTPNNDSKNTAVIMDIMDMMNKYQILNSQMKYMTYTTGLKAMDKMGNKLAEKAKAGETYSNMQDLFKEWLNTSDSYFVELFETDEFSKVQAETSSLSLRIKGAVNLQQEKLFANIPLVPRSEMDELYKTVYELKKKVRSMEKELESKSEPVAEKSAAPVATSTSKTTAKKTSK